MAFINKAIDARSLDLLGLNKQIHSNPELGYKEYQAHDNICHFLENQGIRGMTLTRHAFGLETSFLAEYGKGGRVVTFNVEYDALPGIGHACGHNLIATGSIAAFLGVVAVMSQNPDVPGRVRALGTPAEEGGGGKIKLIDAGAYDDVDACLMTHPMAAPMFPPTHGGIAYGTSVASAKFGATFTGKPAHAAAAPWEGNNALDAAVLAYTGLGLLRQQVRDGQRIQVVILEGGKAPGIITERAVLDMNVRAKTMSEARELQGRAEKCFEGAAAATGCTVEFKETNAYDELVPNPIICKEYAKIMESFGVPQLCNVDSAPYPGSWSTDMGNVTKVIPGFHGTYTIPTPNNAANHTHGFTEGAASDEAHRLTILTAKAMAGVAWRIISDVDFAKQVAVKHMEMFPIPEKTLTLPVEGHAELEKANISNA